MENYKKKYEAVIKQAKEELKICGSLDCDAARQIFRFFPELKESKDEKMRNFISNELACLRATDEKGSDRYEELTNAIAWLEKQGERKPSITVHKFRVGDNVKTINKEPLTITKIDDKGYWSGKLFICDFDEEVCWDLVKQKPADNLRWNELTWEDVNTIEEIINEVHFDFRNGIGAESFGEEVLERFREIKGDEYMDTYKQKPTWSEEDEQNFNVVLSYVNDEYLRRWLKDVVHEKYDKSAKERMKGE